MNFDFSSEQEQFRDQSGASWRRAMDSVKAIAAQRQNPRFLCTDLQGLAALGVQAAAIPEAHAGLGLGCWNCASRLRKSVAYSRPSHFYPPSVSVPKPSACLDPQGRREVAAGSCGWLDHRNLGFAEDDRGGEARATRSMAGTIIGTKGPVLDGMIAKIMIVVSEDASGALVLMLCDLDQTAVVRQPIKTLDPTRPAASIRFNAAIAEALPNGDGDAWRKIWIGRQCARVEQLGAAETALASACEYAHDRIAFGRKIGSFQAVKHNWPTCIRRSNSLGATATTARGPSPTDAQEAPLAAAGARCSATDAFEFAAQEISRSMAASA